MNRLSQLSVTDAATRLVQVETTARLHLGFIDLTRRRPRQFGSLGLAIEAPRLAVALAADQPGEGIPDGIVAAAATIAERLGVPAPAVRRLTSNIPRHAGLGSGTQLALALTAAIAALHGLDLTQEELAIASGRGRRSGIGIGAFAQGGFVVDAGRSADSAMPPVVAQQPFPEDWRVLLITDDTTDEGLSGDSEVAAFESLPGMSAAVSNELAYLVLMALLPALAEGDFDSFTRAVGRIQDANGDHFASAQNGRYRSPRVSAALEWLRQAGVAGIGQSSWGPTGFAFAPSEDAAQTLLNDLNARFSDRLGFTVARGWNRGADIAIAADPAS